jgi:hypothetical protein
MLGQTIQVGKVTLILGTNNGMKRYEGVTENARMLIRQDPWGTWSACIVKKHGKGSIINISGNYQSPEDAGDALISAAVLFSNALDEVIDK